ncbi:MAG: hypothetical protein ABSH06_06705 [Thermodesulfobacteriota bacterium]
MVYNILKDLLLFLGFDKVHFDIDNLLIQMLNRKSMKRITASLIIFNITLWVVFSPPIALAALGLDKHFVDPMPLLDKVI